MNMIHPVIKRILKIYLSIHFALMVVVTWGPILWVYFPEFFVLYGGTQAVVIWRLLKAAHPISDFRIRSIYFFSLLEVVYTIAMLCWRPQYNVSFSEFRYLFSREPNTYVLEYAVLPNLLFVAAALIWFVVHYVKNKHANKGEGPGGA